MKYILEVTKTTFLAQYIYVCLHLGTHLMEVTPEKLSFDVSITTLA